MTRTRLMGLLRRLLTGRDKGSVAVQLIFVLPLLLVIVGTIVQFALLVNAHFVLKRAIAAAARSAMTSLPTDQGIGEDGGVDYVKRSAYMTLESLSPASPDTPSDEAVLVADGLRSLGLKLPDDSYEARYTFAEEGAQITIVPLFGSDGINDKAPDQDKSPDAYYAFYAQNPNPRVTIQISYPFRLTAPLVGELVGKKRTVAGVEGWYTTITETVNVQLSPGREAGGP